MDKIQNIVLGVVVLGLVIIGWQIGQLPQQQPQGAVSSPDINSPWVKIGNVKQWFYTSNFLPAGNASTTVCSFRSPDATSTLAMVSANVATTSFTTVLEIGYSQGLASSTHSTVTPAVPTATTTLLAHQDSVTGPYFLNATSSLFGVSTTSPLPAITNNIIFPRSYINVKVGGAPTTTNTISGTCKVQFVEL